MGFFARFSGKPARQRAVSLAQSFSEKCPPPGAKRKAPSSREIEAALSAIYQKAAAFSRERRLGILGRARFAKAFQDELLGLGYNRSQCRISYTAAAAGGAPAITLDITGC